MKVYKTILLTFASCVAIQTIADLTAEQRASIDASADRALLKDASEEGTTAYWLFRIGPAKIRQISCAMNADDYMLAKQLRDEVGILGNSGERPWEELKFRRDVT